MRQMMVALFIVLCGCLPVRDPRDLEGHYRLTSKAATIVLDIWPNHMYSESIKYSDGAEESSTNRWDWFSGCLEVEAFILPNLAEKNDPKHLDDETASRVHLRRTPRGTDQSDRCLSGEKHAGGIRLKPYPDESIEFQMTRHY